MSRHCLSKFSVILVGIVSILQSSLPLALNPIQVSLYPALSTVPLPCGSYELDLGQLVQIQSPNFGTGVYSNSFSCDWRFTGNNCGINVICPCSSIPPSFQCLGDYLRFTDPLVYNQRFCGDVQPQGYYRTVTGTFKIRFRSDGNRGDQGFLCYVGCSVQGLNDTVGPVQTRAQCSMPIPPLTTTATPPVPPTPGSTTNSTVTSAPITLSTGQQTISTADTPPPGFRIPPGCRIWKQYPVGETIREPKPTRGPIYLPPWCWNYLGPTPKGNQQQ